MPHLYSGTMKLDKIGYLKQAQSSELTSEAIQVLTLLATHCDEDLTLPFKGATVVQNFTAGGISEKLKISYASASRAIQTMSRAKLLTKVRGAGRKMRWKLPTEEQMATFTAPKPKTKKK